MFPLFRVLLVLTCFFAVYCPDKVVLAQETLLDFEEQGFKLKLVRKTSGGPGLFELSIKAPKNASYTSGVIKEPVRLIVEIEKLKVLRPHFLSVLNDSFVRRVSFAQHEGRVRVVTAFKTLQVPAYTISRIGENLVVEINFAKTPIPEGAESASSAALTTLGESMTKAPERPIQAGPPLQTPSSFPAGEVLPPTPSEVSKKREALITVSPKAVSAGLSKEGTAAPTVTPSPLPSESPAFVMVPLVKPEIIGIKRLPGARGEAPERVELPESILRDANLLHFAVDRTFITFFPKERPIQNLVVKNKTDRTLYMMASVQAVQRPGFDDQFLEPSDNLLVSPRRFELERGGQRTLRLLLRKPALDREQVYRIVLLPQRESFEKNLVDVRLNGRIARLDVIAGMAITVSALPLESRSDLTWEKIKDVLVLRNVGNAGVYLDSGRFCPEGQTRCLTLPSKRLYPGNSWGLRLPGRGRLQFLTKTGADFESLIISADEL